MRGKPVDYDVDRLSIIHYPDPRLRQVCQEVTEFDDKLPALAAKMATLRRADKGVGLAAAQVGVPLRMFVLNLTGEEKDEMVFVNPVIHDPQGSKETEEGCLSVPNIHVQVRRPARCRITAQDLKGNPIELEGEDLLCRVWHHEIDHLNGILILDRMGPSDRIATRKTLKEMEATYQARVSA